MHALQDQNLEHQHMIERWAAAFAAIRRRHRLPQRRPKHLEVDQAFQPFQIIALGGKILQPLVNIEKASLSSHRLKSPIRTSMESHQAQNREVLGGVQFALENLS